MYHAGHDPNDYEIGRRVGLETINIMNKDGSLNAAAGAYAGMDRFDARKKLWADMEAAGLVIKKDNYTTRYVDHCFLLPVQLHVLFCCGYTSTSDSLSSNMLAVMWSSAEESMTVLAAAAAAVVFLVLSVVVRLLSRWCLSNGL